MRGAPVDPAEYDEFTEPLTDEILENAGYATGLHVWEQMGKAYEWYLSNNQDVPDGLDNAQMWSLRQAIRAEALAELREKYPAANLEF